MPNEYVEMRREYLVEWYKCEGCGGDFLLVDLFNDEISGHLLCDDCMPEEGGENGNS